jgi:hypothetical protein
MIVLSSEKAPGPGSCGGNSRPRPRPRLSRARRPGPARSKTPPPAPARPPRRLAIKETPDGLTLYRYRDLLGHLATLTRQVINFNGQAIEKITAPTPVQARAFELLGSAVTIRLT